MTMNKTKREMEIVYPGEEFFMGLTRMLLERTDIKIAIVSKHSGDIVFTTTYEDLGITPQTLNHPFYHSIVFGDFIGELLVRNNLDQFSARIMDKSFCEYDKIIREYNHKHFGFQTTKNDTIIFQCHASLIYQLVNERLNQEISQEVAKISATIVTPKKVKRGGDEDKGSIVSYCDDNNMRLIIPKTNEIRHGFEIAIAWILNFYKITGKEVFIANNLFNWEIEIKNK